MRVCPAANREDAESVEFDCTLELAAREPLKEL